MRARGWILVAVALAVFALASADDPADGNLMPTSEVAMHVKVLQSDADNQKKGRAAEGLVNLLKAGDTRLVKDLAIPATKKVQDEITGMDGVEAIAKVFVALESSLALKIFCLEALYLLTLDNPMNRDRIRKQGVLPVVVEMLQLHTEVDSNPVKTRGNEMAAEAAYILAYDNADSIKELSGLDAVTKLIVLSSSGRSERTKMWACAGLQNMAADYPRKRLYSNRQRQTMLGHGAIPILVHLVKTGPSSLPPSKETEDLADHKGIAAWAAAGAIKNLALSKETHIHIRKYGGVEALEALQKSKDPLESKKATTALRRLVASERDEL